MPDPTDFRTNKRTSSMLLYLCGAVTLKPIREMFSARSSAAIGLSDPHKNPVSVMPFSRAVLFGMLLCLSCILMQAASAADRPLRLNVLEIPDIHRGAGLAVVIQTPSGKTFLYDTGSAYPDKDSPDGWAGQLQSGRDLIAPLLKQRGVEKIDAVFISHAHYDHFGGLLWLMDHISIGKLIDCGYQYQGKDPENYRGAPIEELDHYTRVREAFRQRGTYQMALAGDVLDLDPDLKIEVIAPPRTYFGDPIAATRSKKDSASHYLVNANSLMLRMQYDEVTILFPGDIQTADMELSLLPFVDPQKLRCDLLIVPGHGIHPLPEEFVVAARPEVSIASVFPRYAKGIRSTPTLKAFGVRTYVTGLHGNVDVECDGKSLIVKAERDETASDRLEGTKSVNPETKK
jgi:competence protein ComEC